MDANRITRKALRHLIREYRAEVDRAIADYDYIKEHGSYKPTLSTALHYNKLIHDTKQVLKSLS
jgi:hypothetical protein